MSDAIGGGREVFAVGGLTEVEAIAIVAAATAGHADPEPRLTIADPWTAGLFPVSAGTLTTIQTLLSSPAVDAAVGASDATNLRDWIDNAVSS